MRQIQKLLDGRRGVRALAALATIGVAASSLLLAGESCPAADGVTGGDIVLRAIDEVRLYGSAEGKTAYSIGTNACNLGDATLDWEASTAKHPVIGQALYRLEDGRFEQLGLSWLKHGFAALNLNLCGQCEGFFQPGLGAGCSDPYSADLNASQPDLGPRFEVNPVTGSFPFPPTGQGQTGDVIFKRLQVATEAVTPALHPEARYFVEGQYVHYQDAAAGNDDNNASYREVAFDGDLRPAFAAPTRPTRAAIRAWAEVDPAVQIRTVDVPDDGRLSLATRVTDRGGGQWHYEYALHNLNSHRAVGRFSVPVPAGVAITNVGFHDVAYHSGEPFDGTDWTPVVPGGGGGTLSWETVAFDVDPDANALRWGTTYNFRFDADVPPRQGDATLGLFRPGTPESVAAQSSLPCVIDTGYALALTVGALVRGETTTLEASGAAPDESVTFVRSTAGEGCGPCLRPLGGHCLDVLAPFAVAGQATADAAGIATLEVTLPPDLPADAVSFQAAAIRGTGGAESVRSNPVTEPVVDP